MPSRGHKKEDYLIFKRGLSYIEKRIILYRGEDNPLWRSCFSVVFAMISIADAVPQECGTSYSCFTIYNMV